MYAVPGGHRPPGARHPAWQQRQRPWKRSHSSEQPIIPPPLLPSSSDKNCLRIIRLEFGSLYDLATILLELMEGRTLTRGSVVLLFSATHLANVGLAAYIEDLVEAKKRILGALRRDIYISSAPPMLLAGTENKELISNIFALEEWVSYGVTEEIYFYNSSRVALDSILENRRGGGHWTALQHLEAASPGLLG